jgi:hypothetical protein
MYKRILFFTALAILTSMSSCRKDDGCTKGSGTITSEILYSPEFTGVKASGSFDIVIQQGEEHKIEAIGHPNIIDRIQTDVSGDLLTIDLESGCFRDFELAMHITLPSIDRLLLDGSGNINVLAMENDSDLEIDLRGSGDITLYEMELTQNLFVRIDGSGEVKTYAAFPDLINLEIDIEGSGDYRGFDTESENCTVSINGSGDVRTHANSTLDVEINGSGNVHYRGAPAITVDISGSGDLIDAN